MLNQVESKRSFRKARRGRSMLRVPMKKWFTKEGNHALFN